MPAAGRRRAYKRRPSGSTKKVVSSRRVSVSRAPGVRPIIRHLPETEQQFQQTIIDLAELMGWRQYHTYDSRRCVPGFPDLVLVRPPCVIFAEVKRETESPTDKQREWLADLSRCPGVRTCVWRPSDWPAIVKLLTEVPSVV